MKKLIVLLLFVTMIACTKEPTKLSCDAVNDHIEKLEQQVISYSDQYADGLITFDQYLTEMDRLTLAATIYYEQLKDCE